MSFHDCLYRFKSRAGPGSYEDVCCDSLKKARASYIGLW